MSEIITAELATLIANDVTDLPAHNASFLEKHSSSAPHILAGLRARQHLDPKTVEQNRKDLQETLGLDSAGLDDAVAGLELLKEWNSPSAAKDAYLAQARQRWPEATVFRPVRE